MTRLIVNKSRPGMLYDILKDIHAFQDLAREGRLAGLEEGRKEGRQEGLENVRLAILEIVKERFTDPALIEDTRKQVATINDLETLRHLIVKVAQIQKAEEVAPLLAQFATSMPARKKTTRTRRTSKQAKE